MALITHMAFFFLSKYQNQIKRIKIKFQAQFHIEDHKQTLEKYEISQRNEENTMDFDQEKLCWRREECNHLPCTPNLPSLKAQFLEFELRIPNWQSNQYQNHQTCCFSTSHGFSVILTERERERERESLKFRGEKLLVLLA